MLNQEIMDILKRNEQNGWILEPEAKKILQIYGLDIPEGTLAQSKEQALDFARNKGFPLVAKVVSSQIVHKSDVGGVITGINSEAELTEAFERLEKLGGFKGLLLEKTVSGTELFLGAKFDNQFGPVVLLGIGGTAVEVYNDVALRMAPLKKEDTPQMLEELKGKKLLQGFRGQEAINIEALSTTVSNFSELVMDLEKQIESIDLNPLFCSAARCIVADARIMLLTAE